MVSAWHMHDDPSTTVPLSHDVMVSALLLCDAKVAKINSAEMARRYNLLSGFAVEYAIVIGFQFILLSAFVF